MEPQDLHQHYQSTLTQKEMIYDLLGAAAADIRRAQTLMNGDRMGYEEVHRSLMHAQAIFHELRGILPLEDESRLLFDALIAALADANVAGSAQPLGEALNITERLRIVYRATLTKAASAMPANTPRGGQGGTRRPV